MCQAKGLIRLGEAESDVDMDHVRAVMRKAEAMEFIRGEIVALLEDLKIRHGTIMTLSKREILVTISMEGLKSAYEQACPDNPKEELVWEF